MSPPERVVPCPGCRGPALYAARNPWRPFCSERCRSADLGAWASERFRVAAEHPPEPQYTPGVPDEPHAPPARH